MIFYQPGFPWNKGDFPSKKLPLGVRSCEVAKMNLNEQPKPPTNKYLKCKQIDMQRCEIQWGRLSLPHKGFGYICIYIYISCLFVLLGGQIICMFGMFSLSTIYLNAQSLWSKPKVLAQHHIAYNRSPCFCVHTLVQNESLNSKIAHAPLYICVYKCMCIYVYNKYV